MKYNPYSFSKMESWNSCPYKFKLNYIDKIKIEKTQNLALYRGSYFHHCIEQSEKEFGMNEIFTEEEKLKCDEILKRFYSSDVCYHLRDEGITELKFGFNSKLELLDYSDKDVWIRGAIDYHYFKDDKLIISDWKSGSYKDLEYQSNSQTMLYAIWGFLKYPHIEEIDAYYVYIEHNKENKFTFKRSEFRDYVMKFFKNTKFIENDDKFVKRPTNLCNWCDFKQFGHCDGEMKIELSSGFGDW